MARGPFSDLHCGSTTAVTTFTMDAVPAKSSAEYDHEIRIAKLPRKIRTKSGETIWLK